MLRVLLVSVTLLASFAAAQPRIHLWVDAVNGNDLNPGTRAAPLMSITTAVNVGMIDTTIHVLPGTYSPSLTGERFTIVFGQTHRNVSVIGEDPATCIVDFERAIGSRNGWYFLIDTGATNIEIANLHMTNGEFQPTVAWFSSAIWWYSVNGLNLHGCIIESCESGIYSANGAQNVAIHDNVFLRCNIPVRLRQDSSQGAQNVAFYNNLIANSTGGYNDTVSPSANDPTQVIVNNIAINNAGDGFSTNGIALAAGIVFENNNAFNNGGPAYNILSVSSSNRSVDPRLVNLAMNDFHLAAGSPMIEAGYVASLPGMVNDFYGDARVTDADSNLVAVPDIGVHEVSGLSLGFDNFASGQTAQINLSSGQPQLVTFAALLLSLDRSTGFLQPFGSITIDLVTTISIGTFGVPSTTPIAVPPDPGLIGAEAYFQAATYAADQSWRMSGRVDVVF